ncbi:MAG TPA: CPBP family glutamic-type intramembrane protease [Gemmatimonadales bacterium]|nr:CPBP family glutamic-type intramembrane protease [Gemmatimonadales bacterium]
MVAVTKRLPFLGLLVLALAAWWISDHTITPWIQRLAGYDQIHDKALSILLGHWVFGQLPRVVLCVAVWLMGARFGLMPSLRQSLGSGMSWRKVVVTGLIATAIGLVLTFAIAVAAGGAFGFHPYVPKMAGDLVSNLYEEIVYRGLFFCSFFGVAAGTRFLLSGPLDRAGLIVGTIGSCFVFALGHEQYEMSLRIAIGVLAIVLVYPWAAARSLWASWIPHTLGDFITDSIVTL